jgi:hypothetical protein
MVVLVYVRLSLICRSMNMLKQSKNWIFKAKLCKSDEPEFDVLLSEFSTDDMEESKRYLDHAYKQVILLHNMWSE